MTQEIAEAHWEFIKELLLRFAMYFEANFTPNQLKMVGWLYKEAFLHGYKHGKEE